MRTKPVNIYLVRHGQTLFNLLERVQGWCDSPLTKDGITIAQACGAGLADIEFVASYSSDLKRAKDTLDILLLENNNQKPTTVEDVRLRELCFGDFEGAYDLERKEACSKLLLGEINIPGLHMLLKTDKLTPRDMMNATASIDQYGFAESYDTVEKRAKEVIEDIASHVFAQGGGNVLVVSHGVTMATILGSFPGEQPENVRTKNASVSILSYDGEVIQIEKAGSMEYVEKGTQILT